MGASKRATSINKPSSLRDHSVSQTRASLPPKPGCQKRTRNTLSTTAMPPPPHAADSGRARRSWSRRSASWTPDEDAKLIELVKKETSVPPSITASKTWSRVATQLTKRTGKQCRERYLNQLKPGIRRDPWSPEEERILHNAHARIGNKWVAIANQLPGRTDNCVKNHWNSMLRKRQRREAALKAAEKEVSATLGRTDHHLTDFDRKSEADHSMYTGCATPSGASSSMQEFPMSSGIPSPFTASSPITPRRDAKLQISSLVAASTKELPEWNVQSFTRHSMRMPPVCYPKSAEARNGQAGIVMDNQIPQNMSHALCSTVAPEGGNTMMVNSKVRDCYAKPMDNFVDNASPLRNMGSLPRMPVLLQGLSNEVTMPAVGVHCSLRRSSRLGCATGSDKSGGMELKCSGGGIQKRGSTKGRHVNHGVENPLAALAAAASSVPPSPLTPESRFSGTSRSRSVSPDPVVWDGHAKVVPECHFVNEEGIGIENGRGKRRECTNGGYGSVNGGTGGCESGKEGVEVKEIDAESGVTVTIRKSSRHEHAVDEMRNQCHGDKDVMNKNA